MNHQIILKPVDGQQQVHAVKGEVRIPYAGNEEIFLIEAETQAPSDVKLSAEGTDLVILYPTGEVVIVENYFNHHAQFTPEDFYVENNDGQLLPISDAIEVSLGEEATEGEGVESSGEVAGGADGSGGFSLLRYSDVGSELNAGGGVGAPSSASNLAGASGGGGGRDSGPPMFNETGSFDEPLDESDRSFAENTKIEEVIVKSLDANAPEDTKIDNTASSTRGTLVVNEQGDFSYYGIQGQEEGIDVFTVTYPIADPSNPGATIVVTETLIFQHTGKGEPTQILPTLSNEPVTNLFDDPDNELPQAGSLVIASVDIPANSGSAGTPVEGANGTIVVNEDGTYDYIMDPNNPLAEGEQETYTLTYTDLNGKQTTEVITIVGDGNGGAELFPHTSGVINVPDDSNPLIDPSSVPGDITVTALETKKSGEAGDLVEGNDGTLVVNVDGTFDFTPSEDAVPGNTETFTVTYPPVGGGSPVVETLTFLIAPNGTATLIPPSVTNEPGESLFDDVDNNLPEGGIFTVNSIDVPGNSGAPGEPVKGANGVIVVNENGTFDYVMDIANPLAEGEQETYTLTYTDVNGKQTTEVITIVGDGNGGAELFPHTSGVINVPDDSNPLIDPSAVPGDITVTALETKKSGEAGDLVEGNDGTLVVNIDGTFDFTPSEDAVPGNTETFTVTYPPVGGADPVTETLTFLIQPDGTVTIVPPTVTNGSGESFFDDPDNQVPNTANIVVASIDVPGSKGAAGTPVSGDNGFLVFNKDGSYDYVMDPNNKLNAGETETFTITYTDSAGRETVETLVFVGNGTGGASVAPTFSLPIETADNPGNPSTAANTDFDEITVTSLNEGNKGEGGELVEGELGSLVFNPDGSFDYNPVPGAPAGTDIFTVTYPADTGTVTQILAFVNDGSGNITIKDPTSGTIGDPTTDPDTTNRSFPLETDPSEVIVAHPAPGAGKETIAGKPLNGHFGILVVNPDGTFDYLPEDGHPAGREDLFTVTYPNPAGGPPITETLVFVHDGTGAAPLVAPDSTGDLDAPEESPNINPIASIYVHSEETGLFGLPGDLVNGDDSSIVFNPDGSFDINVHTDSTAADGDTETFTVTYIDTKGVSTTQEIVVKYDGEGGANVLPFGANAINAITEGTATVNGEVINYDADGGYANVTGGGAGTYGTLTINNIATGAYTYALNNGAINVEQLAKGETVTDRFNYTVDDGQGGQTTHSIEIIITGTNDAPVGMADALTLNENIAKTSPVNLLSNDTDIDNGHTLSVKSVEVGSSVVAITPGGAVTLGLGEGKVTVHSNGTFSFDPNGGYESLGSPGEIAIERFTYTVTDEHGATHTASVEFTITGVNDAPVIVVNSVPVTEGAINPIDNTMILVTDVDETPAEILITASNVIGGHFAVATDPNTSIGSFTQEDINNGKIVFVHDGSETPASWDLTATDPSALHDSSSFDSAKDLTHPFTYVNDAPVIDTNSAPITEGLITVLTGSMIHAGDPDNSDSELTFTVDSISGGMFQLAAIPGTPIVSFTQKDIESGRVQFVHDGSETVPKWTLTVSDGQLDHQSSFDGSLSGSFTSVNDGPVITANSVPITEGRTTQLDNTMINSVDPDNNPAELIYTPTNIKGGEFQLVGSGIRVKSFTQEHINNGSIQFVHDGSETPASWDLAVTDGKLSDTDSFNSATDPGSPFTHINDAPEIDTNTATLREGDTVTLGAGNLHATDPDNTDRELVFIIDTVTGGHFQYAAAPGTPIATFTQADLKAGRVQYVHNGSETVPSWTITVDDGELTDQSSFNGLDTFTAINDGPVIVNNTINLKEGDIVRITADNISASDPDNTASELSFTPTNVVAGHFALASAPGTPILGFTQADIEAGKIVFVHNGSETAPSWDLEVSDSAGLTNSDSFVGIGTFTPVNDGPVIDLNTAPITEGGTTILNSTMIHASDPDNTDPQLRYSVDSIAGGVFEFVAIPGTPIGSFTQDDINHGRVQYVHNGSETRPAWTLTVTDGVLTNTSVFDGSTSGTFTPVNDAPILEENSLTITEGATHTITRADINASDVDNTPSELTFTPSSVVAGHFAVSGTPVTSFTLADVDNGLVTFVHNGSETPASWHLEVSDGGLTDSGSFNSSSGDGSFIAVNDAPVITVNSAIITEGATVTLSASNISSTDPDNTTSELVYTVSNVVGGMFQTTSGLGMPVYTFTQQDLNNGLVQFVHNGSETPPAWDLQVSDGELGDTDSFLGSKGTGTFITVNDSPVAAAATNSIKEGVDTLTATSISGNVTATDVEGDSLTFTTTDLASYGVLTLNSNGSYTYALDNSRASVQALSNGDTLTETFTVNVSDGRGGSTSTNLTIRIDGANDAPSLTSALGALEGVAIEDSTVIATGNVSGGVRDLDAGDSHTFSTTDTGSYGDFVLNSDGTWSYDIDGTIPSIDQLDAGATITESIQVTVTDSKGLSDTENLVVTIYGANDAPHVVTPAPDVLFDVATPVPLPDPPSVAAAEGVEAVKVGSEAFFRGSFVQAGIRDNGTFGASNASRPAGFQSSRANTGLFGFISNSDDNNWATYDGDFFTPGTPAEGFGIDFNGTAFTNNTNRGVETIAGSITGTAVVKIGGQDFAQVYWQGTVSSGGVTIQVDRTFSIAKNGLYVLMDTTLTNLSGVDAANVYWMHTLDPDNNQSINGSYVTTNKLVSKPDATDSIALVQATQTDGSSISFVANDSRARAYHGTFNEVDASTAWNNGNGQAEGTTVTKDTGMQIAFNLETLAAGTSQTFTYAYNLSDDMTSVFGNLTAPDSTVDLSLVDYFDDVDLNDTPENLIYTAELADGSALPSWLSIDGTKLTGTAPIESEFSIEIIITATDSQGASATESIIIAAQNPSVSPIVVDMDGDGAEFDSIENGIRFDADGDSLFEHIAWPSEDDSILVYDHQGDRDVTDRSEIAFSDYVDGAETDLEGLKHFDSDNDGTLDVDDSLFDKFGLWQDADGDGQVGEGEFTSLLDAGIVSISLTSDGQSYTAGDGDVYVHGESVVTYSDGSTGIAADAEFDYAQSWDLALFGNVGDHDFSNVITDNLIEPTQQPIEINTTDGNIAVIDQAPVTNGTSAPAEVAPVPAPSGDDLAAAQPVI